MKETVDEGWLQLFMVPHWAVHGGDGEEEKQYLDDPNTEVAEICVEN